MTVKERLASYDGACFKAKWAADTVGGFGKKGWSAYGDISNCDVIREETDSNGKLVLHVWYTKLWGECPNN